MSLYTSLQYTYVNTNNGGKNTSEDCRKCCRSVNSAETLYESVSILIYELEFQRSAEVGKI